MTAHIRFELKDAQAIKPIQHAQGVSMIRWVLVVLLALILIQGFLPWLRKLGVGKLPGDFEFHFFGRLWRLPLGSTLLLSVVCALIAKWL